MAIATGFVRAYPLGAATGRGKVFLSRSEALALAFPDYRVERDVGYPTAVSERNSPATAGTGGASRGAPGLPR